MKLLAVRFAALLVLSASAVAPVAPAAGAPSAGADDRVGAPVTAPDVVTARAGRSRVVDVLANDTDPDDPSGEALALCRVRPAPDVPVSVFIRRHTNRIEIAPDLDAEPGTYEVTYYACDYDFLTPATIAVTVPPHGRAGAARPRAAARRADPAPVTTDDAVRVSKGFHRFVRVLHNDADPGRPTTARLAVCRVEPPPGLGIQVDLLDGADLAFSHPHNVRNAVLVSADHRTPRGTYRIPYWACDHSSLSRGVLALTVTKSVEVTAAVLRHQPDTVRFRNPGPHGVRVHVERLGGGTVPPDVVYQEDFYLRAHSTWDLRPGVPDLDWFVAGGWRAPSPNGHVSGIRRGS